MTVIKLKRARNSLLNVSRLPSEVLGDIFSRNVTAGKVGRSRNFLFVCHHWFNVASCTPEVWSCWGDTPEDWKKWCFRYPSAPLDLILNGSPLEKTTLDNSLQNALRDSTTRGNVRSIHLVSGDSELLGSIISLLTPNREEILPSDTRSILVLDESRDSPVDVSEFLTYNRFPKLQRLLLDGCIISSWDPVVTVSQTSNLTALAFYFGVPSPVPSMFQIRSIIASNPTLQELSLGLRATLEDIGADSSPLPLPNLRELELIGDSRSIFGLLSQLDHPRNLDKFIINGTVEGIPETAGPYLRHYLQHHGRSGGLGLQLLSTKKYIDFHVGNVGGIDFSAPEPEQMVKFVEITLRLDPFHSEDRLMRAGLDLIAHVPREEVLYLVVGGDPGTMGEVSAQLPNLRALRFEGSSLDLAFPVPTLDENAGIYPSLHHVTLKRVSAIGGDWSPLMTFLRQRMDSGNRLDTLRVIGSDRTSPRLSTIGGLVREYKRD